MLKISAHMAAPPEPEKELFQDTLMGVGMTHIHLVHPVLAILPMSLRECHVALILHMLTDMMFLSLNWKGAKAKESKPREGPQSRSPLVPSTPSTFTPPA